MDATRLLVAFSVLSALCFGPSVAETYQLVDESGPEPVQQDVTVDLQSETVVISESTEESSASAASGRRTLVVDYARSMTGIYDGEARRCYLIGGVPTSVPSASEIKQALDAKDESTPTETLTYNVAKDYPIKDRSLLPTALRRRCARLPLSWMELNSAVRSESSDLERVARQGTCQVCVGVFVVACYSRPCG